MEPRKIFVSWAGEESRLVAKALSFWLPCFSPQLKPWTSFDLTPGHRWGTGLASELASTDAGILCVTAENRDSPWLNFEAGALSRSVAHAQVIPYAIALGDAPLPDPIGQFQSVPATRDGSLRLLKALLASLENEKDFPKMFEAFWPLLQKVISPRSTEDAENCVAEIEKLREARHSLKLLEVQVSAAQLRPGDTVQIDYSIDTRAHGISCWLGASMWGKGQWPIYNREEDKVIVIRRGLRRYFRTLTVPLKTPPGDYNLNAEIWYGPTSDSDNSFPLQGQWPIRQAMHISEV